MRTIEFEAVDESTTSVSWSESLRMRNPLMRHLPVLVDGSVDSGFDSVLSRRVGSHRDESK